MNTVVKKEQMQRIHSEAWNAAVIILFSGIATVYVAMSILLSSWNVFSWGFGVRLTLVVFGIGWKLIVIRACIVTINDHEKRVREEHEETSR